MRRASTEKRSAGIFFMIALCSLSGALRVSADELDAARAQEQQGNLGQAVVLYRQWLDANAGAANRDAVLLHASDIDPSARDDLDLLARFLPAVRAPASRHEVLVRLARAHLVLGDLQAAQRYYSEAALVPGAKDVSSLLASARLLVELGESERASAQARAVIETVTDPAALAQARALLAVVAVQTGRGNEARTMIADALSSGAQLGANVLLQLLVAARTAGLADLADRCVAALNGRFPNSPEAAVASGGVASYPAPALYFAGAPEAGAQSGATRGGATSADSAPPSASGAAPEVTAAGVTGAATTPGARSAAKAGEPASSTASSAAPTVAIQIGSYHDRENAAYRLKDLEDAGFHGVVRSVVLRGQTYYRVLIEGVPEAGLQDELTSLKDKGFEGFVLAPNAQ